MDVQIDVSVANRFISSLSKSIQALCHGCMDFDSGIEIVGYINVNIDCGSKADYVLNEKVLKSNSNSMKFVSNSFLAKKDAPKQARACSPVAELQSVQRSPFKSSFQGLRSSMPFAHSLSQRGSQKRSWPHTDREWRGGPKRHRGGHSASARQAQASVDSPSENNSPDDAHQAPVVKQEALDNNGGDNYEMPDSEQLAQSWQALNESTPQDFDSSLPPKQETQDEGTMGETGYENFGVDGTFLGQPTQGYTSEPAAFHRKAEDSDSNTWPDAGDSNNMSGAGPSEDWGETGDESYYQGAGEGTSDAPQFEVIEIGEEEEGQGWSGDARGSRRKKSTKKAATPMNPEMFPMVNNSQTLMTPLVARPGPAPKQPVTPAGPYDTTCPFCNINFQDRGVLQAHLAEEHDSQLIKCPKCGKGYRSHQGLRNHIQQQHEGIRFSCPVCAKELSSKSKVKRHLMGVHGYMACTICNALFPDDVIKDHESQCGASVKE